MRYPHAKSALSLLIFAIFASLIGAVVCSVIGVVVTSLTSAMTLTSSIISIVCGILTFIAYGIGGKDSNGFHSAFVCEILSLLFAIAAIAFAVVYAMNASMAWASWAGIISSALNSALEILVFYFVCSACSEVCQDAGITKLAKFTNAIYCISVLVTIACNILSNFSNLATAAGILVIVALIATLLAQIMQIILVCKAHGRVK